MTDDESRPRSERRTIALEAIGSFWCEAAVLVAVFGLLEKVVRDDGPSLSWGLGVIGCAIVFLLAGIQLKVWSR